MSTKKKLQLYEYKKNAFVPIKVLTHNYKSVKNYTVKFGLIYRCHSYVFFLSFWCV